MKEHIGRHVQAFAASKPPILEALKSYELVPKKVGRLGGGMFSRCRSNRSQKLWAVVGYLAANG